MGIHLNTIEFSGARPCLSVAIEINTIRFLFFLNERHEIVHVSINKEESEAVPKRHRRKGT